MDKDIVPGRPRLHVGSSSRIHLDAPRKLRLAALPYGKVTLS